MFAWAIIGASVPPTGAPAVKMDHLPLPSLQLYTVFSGLGLFYAVAYSLTASGGLFETLWNDVWCATVRITNPRLATSLLLLFIGCCQFRLLLVFSVDDLLTQCCVWSHTQYREEGKCLTIDRALMTQVFPLAYAGQVLELCLLQVHFHFWRNEHSRCLGDTPLVWMGLSCWLLPIDISTLQRQIFICKQLLHYQSINRLNRAFTEYCSSISNSLLFY